MMTEEKTKRRGDVFLFLISFFAFVLILAFPRVTADSVRSGLDLCFQTVVPAVFPSIVLSNLLFSRSFAPIEKTVGRLFSSLFRVSPRGAVAWTVGLLAGFPTGAITVSNDVKSGRLSQEEGEYLLSFVNNTGPAFLVGGIGVGLFGSAKIGWSLWLLQIPVSLFVALLFRPRERKTAVRTDGSVFRPVDPVSAIVRASETSVRIVGFVCFFSVVGALFSLFLTNGIALSFSSVLLEVGGGAKRAAALPFPFPALPLVSLSVCFSGLSVHFQTIEAIKEAGIRAKKYLMGKIASGLFGFLLALLLCLTN